MYRITYSTHSAATLFREDKKLYRIHWLEVRIRDIHDLIITEGRRKFNKAAVDEVPATETAAAIPASEAVVFHFSWWYLIKVVRPFFVKDAGREVCVWVYHLRFDLFVEAIHNYSKRLRSDLNVCQCRHTNHKSSVDFRRAYTCPRPDSERYDQVACVHNECTSCQDLKLFQLCKCDARLDLPTIKCQIYQQVEYRCKDGTIKNKKDFVPQEMAYSEFEQLLTDYWPKFMLHHDVGKWQDEETRFLKTHLQRGNYA